MIERKFFGLLVKVTPLFTVSVNSLPAYTAPYSFCVQDSYSRAERYNLDLVDKTAPDICTQPSYYWFWESQLIDEAMGGGIEKWAA